MHPFLRFRSQEMILLFRIKSHANIMNWIFSNFRPLRKSRKTSAQLEFRVEGYILIRITLKIAYTFEYKIKISTNYGFKWISHLCSVRWEMKDANSTSKIFNSFWVLIRDFILASLCFLCSQPVVCRRRRTTHPFLNSQLVHVSHSKSIFHKIMSARFYKKRQKLQNNYRRE